MTEEEYRLKMDDIIRVCNISSELFGRVVTDDELAVMLETVVICFTLGFVLVPPIKIQDTEAMLKLQKRVLDHACATRELSREMQELWRNTTSIELKPTGRAV